MTDTASRTAFRLTQYAKGGGCACKIPPGLLESIVAPLTAGAHQESAQYPATLMVGLDDGDDAAVITLPGDDTGRALVFTTDFFTPVVDDAYTWGSIAAANALSDVYAMGATPLLALNLLGWPVDALPAELLAEVLRGGLDVARRAGAHVAGGHSIDDPEPKYGMAVTGTVQLEQLMRNDAGEAGMALSLTKPLGVGMMSSHHKQTGQVSEEAIAVMTTLNRDASVAAVQAGIRCATDVTGFGLLGHLLKLTRASGVRAEIDAAAVPYVSDARAAAADGFISGGTRRNLEWVRPHTDLASVTELEALLLADAQTSGGLLLAGEIPGAPVIGRLLPPKAGAPLITVR